MGNFCPFTPLTAQNIKISQKWNKRLEISSFYTCVIKTIIRWCTVLEIWCVTDGRTDGRTERQTDGRTDGNWHIELGAPPKKTLFSYFFVTQSTPKPQEKNVKQIFTSISFSVTLEMKKIHDKVLKTPLCLRFLANMLHMPISNTFLRSRRLSPNFASNKKRIERIIFYSPRNRRWFIIIPGQ